MSNLETAKDLGQGIYTQAEVNNTIETVSETVTELVNTSLLSTVASSVLLNQDSLVLEDFAITKNFSAVTYTGNGDTQDITTGISSVDFTVDNNGSGFWHDRDAGDCIVKNDAGDVVDEGSCVCNVSKVHVKNRSVASNNFITDGLRGKDTYIITNAADTEAITSGALDFNTVGITLGNNGLNTADDTYISYQTLYTHISWGKTNQDKKYIEAYNPVTRETMIMYEGSGNVGHEIPHSLGVELDMVTVKHLNASAGFRWNTHTKGNDNKALVLNDSTAMVDNDVNGGIVTTTISDISLTDGGAVAETGTPYILYGKSKSETWTIVNYTGTGAAGNFVETLDVNGIGRKPSRVIIKRIDADSHWTMYDNKRRANDSLRILLDNSDSEYTNTPYGMSFHSNGFKWDTAHADCNASGGQYIALVEFDTNSNGGDSYFNLPTDDSNLNIDNGNFTYTNGADGNGYIRSSEQVTQSIDFAGVSDGLKWIGKKLDGTGYIFENTKPSVGLYDKQFADDNRLVFDVESGKHYTTTGGELVTNGGFDIDTSEWTAGNGAILSYESGKLKINSDGNNYPVAYQAFPTVKGATYKALGSNLVTTNSSTLGVSKTASSSTYYSKTVGSTLDSSFTAESTTSYIFMVISTTNDTLDFYFDDISVYKIEPTLDQELVTPVSFLPNPVMVASETPMDIREDSSSIATNVMESLEVAESIKCNDYQGKNACTAWVNFDGTTTPPTIRDSFNVRDVVRTDASKFKVYFQEVMSNGLYAVAGLSSHNGADSERMFVVPKPSTEEYAHIWIRGDGGEADLNGQDIMLQIFGGKN